MKHLRPYLFCSMALALLACTDSSTEPAAPEDDAMRVTMEMVDAWNRMDWDRVVGLFAEDAVFQSMMMEPLVGREVIGPHMRALVDGLERIELQIANKAAVGNVVFIERVDDFVYKGKHSRVPVVGVLEIENGEVAAWREYYDRAQLMEALAVDEEAPAH